MVADERIKVLIYEPLESGKVRTIKNTLESLQDVVGGNIEFVTPFPRGSESLLKNVLLICNEEGKLEGLPQNRFLCNEDGRAYDFVAGTFILCMRDLKEPGEITSLTDQQIALLKQRVGKTHII